MTDGASGRAPRTGYLWVELARVDADGEPRPVTCGVGIRHSTSARQATTWQFTVPGAVPDLLPSPTAAPLSAPRCRELVESLGGSCFDGAAGLQGARRTAAVRPRRRTPYDDLLRLLYWLRQPQVGEDIDPAPPGRDARRGAARAGRGRGAPGG